MTKLEAVAAKHYAMLVDQSMDTERVIRAALREWTEECVQVAAKQYVFNSRSWGDLTSAIAAIRAMAEEEAV